MLHAEIGEPGDEASYYHSKSSDKHFVIVQILSPTEVSIVGVDLLVDANEERCHTDEYESEKYLILRRGEDIQFKVCGIHNTTWRVGGGYNMERCGQCSV